MKKIFALLFIVILSVGVLTGCDSKKEETKEDNNKENSTLTNTVLSCKSTEDEDKVDIYYNGDVVSKMVEELTLDSEEEAEEYATTFNTYYAATSSSKNNVVTIILEGDSLENFLEDAAIDTSKDALRTRLESSGYVCK